MEINQAMLEGHYFVFWLVYASPPCLAFFGNVMACGLRTRERGTKKTLNSTRDRKREGKMFVLILILHFFGDLFWKSLEQADSYLCWLASSDPGEPRVCFSGILGHYSMCN